MYKRETLCTKLENFPEGIVNGAVWYTADGSMQGTIFI
jgi:hypothetical protein